jgi:exodeoxyribonuclease-5
MAGSAEVFKKAFTGQFAVQPTPDQAEAIHHLSGFCCSGNYREVFILRGYAGTGKTTLLGALSGILPSFKMKSELLAPTGRAAKVISNYSGRPAQTIHRKIYQKLPSTQGGVLFALGTNNHKNTIFIVDEASMIADTRSRSEFGDNNLLQDLLEYVFSGENCKLVFTGDTAQLPPVGSTFSPALNKQYLERNFSLRIIEHDLKTVVRQAEQSGILLNATNLRVRLLSDPSALPQLTKTKDVVKVEGFDLEDTLNTAYSKYGFENVLVVCRSNKRANGFNKQIRFRIKWQENELSAGDLLMVVKNNYFWTEGNLQAGKKTDFIANGENLQVERLMRHREMYGFKFVDAVVRLTDSEDDLSLEVTLLMDTLESEAPALTQDQQRQLFENVMADFGEQPTKAKLFSMLKQSPYYNALQVKFSYAITCHKAQGGQWDCVFIDQGYFTKDMLNEDYYRWLYTAITRASEKVYLIGFSDEFFETA